MYLILTCNLWGVFCPTSTLFVVLSHLIFLLPRFLSVWWWELMPVWFSCLCKWIRFLFSSLSIKCDNFYSSLRFINARRGVFFIHNAEYFGEFFISEIMALFSSLVIYLPPSFLFSFFETPSSQIAYLLDLLYLNLLKPFLHG